MSRCEQEKVASQSQKRGLKAGAMREYLEAAEGAQNSSEARERWAGGKGRQVSRASCTFSDGVGDWLTYQRRPVRARDISIGERATAPYGHPVPPRAPRFPAPEHPLAGALAHAPRTEIV